MSPQLSHALRSNLWKTGYLSPRFCTVVDEVEGGSQWRYDVGCMRPAGSKSRQLQADLEALISREKPHRVFWSTESLLVIDNKRMLHARGRSDRLDQDRKLIRILIGGTQ